MNIFEHAMQMELDGKKYYEEHAEKAELPQLKQILMELASDETKHYELFKAMRDNVPSEFENASETKILSKVVNIFDAIKEENKEHSFGEDMLNIWEHARKVEKEAEDFYRRAADDVGDDKKAALLLQIADEEHRHWKSIDNVIAFLKRPTQWLENAEWRNLEDY